MKLLQRTSRYQLLMIIPLVLVGTVIGYWVVKAVVIAEVEEQLEHQTTHIIRQLRQGERTFTTNAPDEFVAVASGRTAKVTVLDTTMLEQEEDEELPWRLMRSSVRLPDGSSYVITVGRSLVETEDLVFGVALSMTVLLALVAVGNLLMNRWMSRKLWMPFHSTLDELDRFAIDGPHLPHLPDVSIAEFTTLNRSLRSMMQKLREDFTSQKRFTEQAAR